MKVSLTSFVWMSYRLILKEIEIEWDEFRNYEKIIRTEVECFTSNIVLKWSLTCLFRISFLTMNSQLLLWWVFKKNGFSWQLFRICEWGVTNWNTSITSIKSNFWKLSIFFLNHSWLCQLLISFVRFWSLINKAFFRN